MLCLLIHLPPRSTHTATLFPFTSRSLSCRHRCGSTRGSAPMADHVTLPARPPDNGHTNGRTSGGRCRACPACVWRAGATARRSEEHKSELQSLMRISYAVFCLKKKKKNTLE